MGELGRQRAGVAGRAPRLLARLTLAALLATIAVVTIVDELTAERVETQLGVAFDVVEGFWHEPHDRAAQHCGAGGRWGSLAGDDVRVLDGTGRVVARSVLAQGRLAEDGRSCRFDLHGVHVYVPAADAYVVELRRTGLRREITASDLRRARPTNVVLVPLPPAAPAG